MHKLGFKTNDQIWTLFKSYKDQYESGRPMTNDEENQMWSLRNELKHRGFKFGLKVKLKEKDIRK